MAAFLLAWNPERFQWESLQKDIRRIEKKGFVSLRWSCGNRRDLPKGSEILLIRLGPEPKGLVGRGTAASEAVEGTHWDDEKRRQKIKAWYVDVHVTELSERPIVPWEDLQRLPLSRFNWSIQASGVTVPEVIVDELNRRWAVGIAGRAGAVNAAIFASHPLAEEIASEFAILGDPKLSVTVKEAIILARRGQGRFRENVLHAEPKCRLTGVTDPKHLIAGHIKPWKDSTNIERLSGDNGLMLGPHADHLFDKGYISFTDVGDLLVSPECAPAVLSAWGISSTLNVRPFSLAQRSFLAYHREHRFTNLKPG